MGLPSGIKLPAGQRGVVIGKLAEVTLAQQDGVSPQELEKMLADYEQAMQDLKSPAEMEGVDFEANAIVQKVQAMKGKEE